MYTLCIVLVLIASVLMVLAVLVQNPKSGMASNFGASNQVMGVRQTTDFLEKLTWGLAVAIFVLSLAATLAVDNKPAQSPVAAKAAELIKNKDFGKLVVMKNNEVDAILLSETAGKLKYVSPDDKIIAEAKTLGISFGD